MAYCTIDELAAALRVRVTPENTDGLQACVDAAAAEIDHECGRDPANPIPAADPLANRANIVRAVEWFKSQDTAFGIVGFNETGSLQVPRDGFYRHAVTLTPLKQSWGVA